VQIRTRFGAPATTARIFWMLGFQRRFVRRWEWLTRMPTWGRFPQTSQTADIENLTLGATDRPKTENVSR
jgi:hypothetical protein